MTSYNYKDRYRTIKILVLKAKKLLAEGEYVKSKDYFAKALKIIEKDYLKLEKYFISLICPFEWGYLMYWHRLGVSSAFVMEFFRI